MLPMTGGIDEDLLREARNQSRVPYHRFARKYGTLTGPPPMPSSLQASEGSRYFPPHEVKSAFANDATTHSLRLHMQTSVPVTRLHCLHVTAMQSHCLSLAGRILPLRHQSLQKPSRGTYLPGTPRQRHPSALPTNIVNQQQWTTPLSVALPLNCEKKSSSTPSPSTRCAASQGGGTDLRQSLRFASNWPSPKFADRFGERRYTCPLH